LCSINLDPTQGKKREELSAIQLLPFLFGGIMVIVDECYSHPFSTLLGEEPESTISTHEAML